MFRRPVKISLDRPLISFTFDDYPVSSLVSGGAILHKRDLRGTYYVAMGLLGGDSPSGAIVSPDHVQVTLNQGHELGCHTFAHNDSWSTDPSVFEDSILRNRSALHDLVPNADFKSFSYPLRFPHPLIKRAAGRHFSCCRGGSQRTNTRTADLNQLSAYFLEKARGNSREVRDLIDQNRELNGWLIFATHDIASNPSPYGCTPKFFEEVVEYAIASGARILPVGEALQVITNLPVGAAV